MDYFLIYKNKDKKIMAAVPDVEGVYKKCIPFEDYDEDITSREVIIAKVNDLEASIYNEDEEYLRFEIIGKFVASQKISLCIEKLGFEKFFTTIIKKHIEKTPYPEE